jgi:hypothetical protein
MAFYVKLGHRGLVFRVGTILIGVLGSWVYWRASRRRGMMEESKLVPVLVEDGKRGA